MSTKFKIDGISGKAAIWTGDDNVLTDPTIDPSRVAFHSDLTYMTVVADETLTGVSLAQPQHVKRNGFEIIENYYYFTDHNLGTVPYGVFLIDGEQVVNSDYDVQMYFNGQNSGYYLRRQLVPGYDENRVWLREYLEYQNLSGGGTPGRTIDVRAMLFAPNLEETIPNVTAGIEVDRVSFGNGKFDTNKTYIRNTNNANPLFRHLSYQTIDGHSGILRMLTPDGGVQQFGNGVYDEVTDEGLAPIVGQGFEL